MYKKNLESSQLILLLTLICTLTSQFSFVVGRKKNKTKTLLHSRHYCFCSKHRKQISNVPVGKHRKEIFYTFKKIGLNITYFH